MNHTNNTPQTYNDDENYHPDYSLMIAFSPLILLMVVAIMLSLYVYVWKGSINIIKNIKNRIKVSFNSPIVNNKLNKKYIKKLNNDNKQNIDNTDQCPICFKDINTKDKILVLDCKHVFCVKCAQDWVKTRVSNGQTPDCPICRSNIIRKEDIIKKEFVVINLDYDSDSSQDSLSDFYRI